MTRLRQPDSNPFENSLRYTRLLIADLRYRRNIFQICVRGTRVERTLSGNNFLNTISLILIKDSLTLIKDILLDNLATLLFITNR